MTRSGVGPRTSPSRSDKKPTVASAKTAAGVQVGGVSAHTTSKGGSSASTQRAQLPVVSGRHTLEIRKVFSATKARDRERLGEKITEWLRSLPKTHEILDVQVRQSSDREFHCLSFYFVVRLP